MGLDGDKEEWSDDDKAMEVENDKDEWNANDDKALEVDSDKEEWSDDDSRKIFYIDDF